MYLDESVLWSVLKKTCPSVVSFLIHGMAVVVRQVWGVGGEEVIREATAAHAVSRVIVTENMAKAAKVGARGGTERGLRGEQAPVAWVGGGAGMHGPPLGG